MGHGKGKKIFPTNPANDQAALDHLARFTPMIDVSGKGKKKVNMI